MKATANTTINEQKAMAALIASFKTGMINLVTLEKELIMIIMGHSSSFIGLRTAGKILRRMQSARFLPQADSLYQTRSKDCIIYTYRSKSKGNEWYTERRTV